MLAAGLGRLGIQMNGLRLFASAVAVAVPVLATMRISPVRSVPLAATNAVLIDFEGGPGNGVPISEHYLGQGVSSFGPNSADFEFATVASPPSGSDVARMVGLVGIVNFDHRISSFSTFFATTEAMLLEFFPLEDASGTIVHSVTLPATGSLTTFRKTLQSFGGAFAGSLRISRGPTDHALFDDFTLCEETGFPIEQLPVFNSTVEFCDTVGDALGIGCGSCSPSESEIKVELSLDLGTSEGVLLHSGQEVKQETDLALSGRDRSVEFAIRRRHVTRVNANNSPFGEAWAFNYSRIVRQGPGMDLYIEGFGRVDRFVQKSTFVWEGTVGRFARAEWDGNSGLIVRLPSGLQMEFFVEGVAGALEGHLVAIKSVNQNAITLEYDPAAVEPDIFKRRLLRMTESYGRLIEFFYEDLTHPTLATRVTDFSGREVEYTYDADGDLIAVRSPTVTTTGGLNDFPNGKTRSYTYRKHSDPRLAHALTSVVYANQVAAAGQPRLAWTYEEDTQSPFFGFVRTHTIGNQSVPAPLAAGGTFQYDYALLAVSGVPTVNTPVIETTVTDRRNTVTELEFNRTGQTLQERVISQGLRPAGPSEFLSVFVYNDDGQLTSVTRPLTGTVDVTYPDPATTPRLEQGVQLVWEATPDARLTDQDFIRTKVIYEPVFNRPFKVIDPRAFESGNTELQFTTTHLFDYMEDLTAATPLLAADLGLTVNELQARFAAAGVVDLATDVNGDSNTSQRCGNVIKIIHPEVDLPSQAATLGLSTTQVSEKRIIFNSFGQQIRVIDEEENEHSWSYYEANDPDGDGVIDVPGPPTSGGGYLASTVEDLFYFIPTRNSGHPTLPVFRTTFYKYTAAPGGVAGIPANLRGIPTSVQDGRGTLFVHLVNELDQVVKTIEAAAVAPSSGLIPFAYESQFIFDHNNNVVETRIQNKDGPDGVDDFFISTSEYDILDLERVHTDDVGGLDIQSKSEYDPSTNMVQVVRGAGSSAESVSEWTLDERNLEITFIRGVGTPDSSTHSTLVNDNGAVTGRVDASGDTTTYELDGFDRLRQTTDREGGRLVRSYDSASNVVELKAHGRIDPFVAGEVMLSHEEYVHDERNRRFQTDTSIFHYTGFEVGVIDGGALNPGDGLVSSIQIFDRLGRLIASIDADGDLSENRYDGAGRGVVLIDPAGNERAQVFDPSNNLTQITETEVSDIGGPDVVFVSNHAFDSLNRLTSWQEPNGQTTTLEYDSRDNKTKITDELGNEAEFRYDRLNRLVEERRYLSSSGEGASASNLDLTQGGGDGQLTAEQTWDALHRMKSRTDDSGNTTDYGWDDLSRLTLVTYEDGTSESSVFNADDELLTSTDQNGSVSTWVHDKKGRPVQVTVDNSAQPLVKGSTVREWSYDGLDRVWEHFDNNTVRPDDVRVSFALDSLGRRIREQQKVGNLPLRITKMEYQGQSRLVSVTYPELLSTNPLYVPGRKVLRTYDELDRLSEVREASDNSLIVKKQYIGPGREVEVEYGNGSILEKAAADFDGNRRTVRHAWEKADDTEITTFTSVYNGPSGAGTNRRVSETRGHLSHTDTYQFDSVYRSTSFLRNGTVASSRTLDGAEKMSTFIDEGTNMSPVIDGDPSEEGLNQYSSFGGNSRVYDDNGNLRNNGDGILLRYDSRNRLVTSTGGPLRGGLYLYDAENRRVGRFYDQGEFVRYMYAGGWNVIEDEDALGSGQATLRQYVDGDALDEHIQVRDHTMAGDPVFYYHCNDQGSVGALTNSAGDVVEYYEYSWLGRMAIIDSDKVSILSESSVGNAYGFHGRRFDPESSLYHYRNRYYDPSTGEFVGIDPSGMWRHGQGNGYSAFAGDGWHWSDPYGLDESTSSDDIGPVELGVEWLTGENRPKHRDFGPNSRMTRLLRVHAGAIAIRMDIVDDLAAKCKESCDPGDHSKEKKIKYDLGGIAGVGKYLRDYSTVLTFGQTGNLGATFTGSYHGTATYTNINCCGGTARVKYVIKNSSSLQSATRPPVIGYWKLWQNGPGRLINGLVESGPGSTITQTYTWTETVGFEPNLKCCPCDQGGAPRSRAKRRNP